MKSAKNINHIRHAKKHAKNINQSDTRRSGFWREISAPLFILILIPAFCLRNSRYISDQTRSWLNQIQIVEDLSGQGDFSAAFDTLSDSYQDWLTARTYLHIVCRHDAVDNAEELYRRCLYLAAPDNNNNNNNQTNAGFLAELSGLRGQLEELAETERFSIGNIL